MGRFLTGLIVCSLAFALCAEQPKGGSGKTEESVSSVPAETQELKEGIEAEGPSMRSVLTGKLLFYVPNRILDVMDLFTLDLKGGPVAGVSARVTRAFGFGAGIGPAFCVVKDCNRQYGFGYENGYFAQFGFLEAEDMSMVNPIGSVKEYWQWGTNFPLPSDEIYNWRRGARDYWTLEAYAAALVGVKAAVHPVEIFDFLAGIFLFDPKGDDIPFLPVRY